MRLGDQLKAIKLPETVLTIEGRRYRVKGLSTSKANDLLAESRDKKGSFIRGKADFLFLSACVSDDETGEAFFSEAEWAEWGDVPKGVTAPLMSECMRICKIDEQDVGREVKNLDTTTSSV